MAMARASRKKKTARAPTTPGLVERLGAFLTDRFPFAAAPVLQSFREVLSTMGGDPGRDAVDHAADGRSVAFAPGGDPEERAEAVVGHCVPRAVGSFSG